MEITNAGDGAWLSWLERHSASEQSSRMSSVQSLVGRVRAAEERTLLSQLDALLHLYMLRELLDSIEVEQVVDCIAVPASPSGSLFRSFLLWAYCAEEAASRNSQLQRLANWFRYSTDLAFFQRLCADNDTQSKKKALSISYFYVLSPRLPQLQSNGTSKQKVEARLQSYLSLRPIERLRKALAADFTVHARIADCDEHEAEKDEPVDLAAMAVLTAVALDTCDRRTLPSRGPTEEAADVSSARDTDSSNNSTSPDETTSDAPSDTTDFDSEQHVSRVRRRKAFQVAPCLDAPTGPARKRKRSCASNHQASSTVAAARSQPTPPPPTAPVPAIACLKTAHAIPLELLSLGVSAWMRKRQLSSEDAAHRLAMDGALVDLMWELADELSDGDRLQVPEFKRARRSQSRPTAAAFSRQMEGERGCNILLNVLLQLSKVEQPV